MVAKTLNVNPGTMGPGVVTTSAGEPRSDMFAQSNALYGRINKRSKTSPALMAGAAVAVVVLVGGIVWGTSNMHVGPAAQTSGQTSGPAVSATSAPMAVTPTPEPTSDKAEPAKPDVRTTTTHRTEVASAVRTSRPASSRAALSTSAAALSAYDLPNRATEPSPIVTPAPAAASPTAPAPSAATPPLTTQPEAVTPSTPLTTTPSTPSTTPAPSTTPDPASSTPATSATPPSE